MYVLLTGATGFIGAHVLDALLARPGLRVRIAARSPAKAEQLIAARPAHASRLDVVVVDDFASPNPDIFAKALGGGITGVVHVASPFTYNVTSNEHDLVIPALNGVNAILAACARPDSAVTRLVQTSSFAAVVDPFTTRGPEFTYTANDWDPLTYEQAADPSTSALMAYRGSKTLAEKAAWSFIKNDTTNPGQKFDLVTLCAPMVFGPIVHPLDSPDSLNQSNKMLWSVAQGFHPLPPTPVPAWIDVRDLAEFHVCALLEPTAAMKRYLVSAPEPFSYQIAADIMRDQYEWARERVAGGDGSNASSVPDCFKLDGKTAASEFGLSYRSFRECVVDFVDQMRATFPDAR